MPQEPKEKLITRKDADLHELRPKYGGPETFTRESLNASGKAFKKVAEPLIRDKKAYAEGLPAANKAGLDAKKLSVNQTVTQRDATNARILRDRLASRASMSKMLGIGGAGALGSSAFTRSQQRGGK